MPEHLQKGKGGDVDSLRVVNEACIILQSSHISYDPLKESTRYVKVEDRAYRSGGGIVETTHIPS
jgi:hypothetical protein